MHEAQKASNEALKAKQEKRKQELRERHKQEKAEDEKRERAESKLDPRDAALKAKIKAEKLRRRLIKEEKRVAKAEAEAEEARVKAEASQINGFFSQSAIAGTKRKRDGTTHSAPSTPPVKAESVRLECEEQTNVKEAACLANEVTPTGQEDGKRPKNDGHIISLEDMIAEASTTAYATFSLESQPPSVPADISVAPREVSASLSDSSIVDALPEEHVAETDSDTDDTMSISSSSPEPSDEDNDTSSSGSSSEEDAPDEAPSKRDGPERVPPPRREKPKSICRQFLKTGHCKRGDRCHFVHELPERGSARAGVANGTKGVKRDTEKTKPKRKRLYERVG